MPYMILIKCQEHDMNNAIRLYERKELILILLLSIATLFIITQRNTQRIELKSTYYNMADSTWDNFYPNK